MKKMVSGITRSYLPGAPIYATAMLVGFFSAGASALLYGLIAAFYMVSSAFFGRADAFSTGGRFQHEDYDE